MIILLCLIIAVTAVCCQDAVIDLKTLGVSNIANCKYDLEEWLFSASCASSSDYNPDFFRNNGYDKVPQSGDVMLTDLQSAYDGQPRQGFVFMQNMVYDQIASLKISEAYQNKLVDRLDPEDSEQKSTDQNVLIDVQKERRIGGNVLKLKQVKLSHLLTFKEQYQSEKEKANLNEYFAQDKLIKNYDLFFDGFESVIQAWQDDFIRLEISGNGTHNLFLIKYKVKPGDFSDDEYKVSLYMVHKGDLDSLQFKIKSNSLEKGNIISAMNYRYQNIYHQVGEGELAMEYNILLVKNHNKLVHLHYFYSRESSGKLNLYHKKAQKFDFKKDTNGKLNDIVSIEMTENFIVSINYRDQIALWHLKDFLFLGFQVFTSEYGVPGGALVEKAGVVVLEQKNRIIISFLLQSYSKYKFAIWNIYFRDASSMYTSQEYQDFRLDPVGFRTITMVDDPKIKLKSVLGGTAIAWIGENKNQINVWRMGTMNQYWDRDQMKFMSCPIDSLTFGPYEEKCTKCDDMDKEDNLGIYVWYYCQRQYFSQVDQTQKENQIQPIYYAEPLRSSLIERQQEQEQEQEQELPLEDVNVDKTEEPQQQVKEQEKEEKVQAPPQVEQIEQEVVQEKMAQSQNQAVIKEEIVVQQEQYQQSISSQNAQDIGDELEEADEPAKNDGREMQALFDQDASQQLNNFKQEIEYKQDDDGSDIIIICITIVIVVCIVSMLIALYCILKKCKTKDSPQPQEQQTLANPQNQAASNAQTQQAIKRIVTEFNFQTEKQRLIKAILSQMQLRPYNNEQRYKAMVQEQNHKATQIKQVAVFDDTCTICMDEFVEGVRIAVTPCNHCFHEECLTQWVTSSVIKSLRTQQRVLRENNEVDLNLCGADCPNCNMTLISVGQVQEHQAVNQLNDILQSSASDLADIQQSADAQDFDSQNNITNPFHVDQEMIGPPGAVSQEAKKRQFSDAVLLQQ